MFRAIAYQTILKVFKNLEFSDAVLRQRAAKIHGEPSNIPLFYTLVKGVVKQRLKLDFILSHYTDDKKFEATDIKIKIMLYIGLYQLMYMDSIPAHAAVNETVELAKTTLGDKVADFVNAVLRAWQRNPEIEYPSDPVHRIACEHSYPPELIEKWISIWGEENTEYLAIYYNENPKLHLRVNSTATTPEKLIQYFAKREIVVEKAPACSQMLITDNADVLDDVAFSEGYFSIQDCSSAMVVDLLDPQPDENILDLFAAPGGKCTYIAEKMENTGEVVAVDKIPSKMKLLKQAADRLQLTNIKQIVTDAFKYGPVAPAYHRVLVDAPCSGWGVFGRKADLRWQAHQNLNELVKLQAKALEYAANFVAKGGTLVYSTCTLNPAENDEQIKNFLARNKNFTLVDAASYLDPLYVDSSFYRTLPFKHNIDGAFAARMAKST
ncbi:MAG TPA: 16S rRNA (cytosine(967)-C(5))-methyltransferase RsmB [Candidatus Cloacimonadota bacterium]|jgi:16S rRNA (cytosine967-C5)-methyltransferase|nr:16S rRNA (cytosine(967)-C(5))-methyltransferase RsmB [Candidatus Cloacimonadota bacterium]HOF59516.1 16S rRNA (cytosine(967)-C(5))-methyltransferase RsmB [Candidatus Cloacimonadota bacterium]HOR58771.1 16S rRNA (cytosine(967)-C(5))-methyltransferase RsmB [Candidatus Cloacimonadota bacterium]HPB08076.1 16S rRNA (cytosine(967)-C(5))-methyltransferase RsmB [Candidatus Cloacimonadota bacterium]HQL13475.1 16S rRNA (cytosine(967)-C(5))-methyltransferase RsmB [Candidatus Cloacimonadota bacterium]